jgi:hypothetical protein
MYWPMVLCALAGVSSAAIGINSRVARGEDSQAFTDRTTAGKDFAVQGEYSGVCTSADGKPSKCGIQVIALGDGKFQLVRYAGGLPGDGWNQTTPPTRTEGQFRDGAIALESERQKLRVADGLVTVMNDAGGKLGELKQIERKSPTLGAKPPSGAVVLFDGKSADEFQDGKLTDDGLLPVGVVSKQKFGDFQLHLEFRTPFMPQARGQARGNSGLYLQNRYEVQILDSFGLEGKDNECGGIYAARPPKVNMCFPPLSWQTYDIDFTAARFDETGKKSKNAVVSVRHNGVLIHEKLELPTFTPGGEGKEAPAPGPLQLQNHGNPVNFRNIWVLPKEKSI